MVRELGQDQAVFSVPDGTTTLDVLCFYKSSVEEVHLPATVEHICSAAFTGCACLRKVVFASDSQLKTIGTHAFS